MNCEKCHGTGYIGRSQSTEHMYVWPKLAMRITCEECGGTGKSHCCDGLKEQPEPDTSDIAEASAEWFKKARLIKPEKLE